MAFVRSRARQNNQLGSGPRIRNENVQPRNLSTQAIGGP